MSRAATPELVRLPVWRARFVLVLFLAGFALVAGRSLYLQAMKTGFLREMGEARYSRVLAIPATRGRRAACRLHLGRHVRTSLRFISAYDARHARLPYATV